MKTKISCNVATENAPSEISGGILTPPVLRWNFQCLLATLLSERDWKNDAFLRKMKAVEEK